MWSCSSLDYNFSLPASFLGLKPWPWTSWSMRTADQDESWSSRNYCSDPYENDPGRHMSPSSSYKVSSCSSWWQRNCCSSECRRLDMCDWDSPRITTWWMRSRSLGLCRRSARFFSHSYNNPSWMRKNLRLASTQQRNKEKKGKRNKWQ